MPKPPTPTLTTWKRTLLTIIASGDVEGEDLKRYIREHIPEESRRTVVYRPLQSLRDDGLIAAEELERDRRRKTYRLTDAGQEWLERMRAWEDHYVDGVVDEDGGAA